MPEEGQFNLSEEYADLGQQVIEAADTAWAELTRIEGQILFIEQLGDLAIEGVTIADNARENLEARKARAQNDAAILGAMAVQVDPEYIVGDRQNGAEPFRPHGDDEEEDSPPAAGAQAAEGPVPAAPAPAEAPEPGPGPRKLVKRIGHKNAEAKEKFIGRASSVVRFIAGQGGMVEQAGGTSAGAIIRDGVSMDTTTWNNFSIRLRQTGILEYEKEYPGAKRISRISINCQRVVDLAQVGDLPADLAGLIEELGEIPEPKASGGDPDFLA